MRTKWIPAVLAIAIVLATSAASPTAGARPIAHRDVTLPAGTVIPLVLDSYVASDTSRIESPVRAHVRRAVVINGMTAIPAGSGLVGHVTRAERAGRVKGRAHLAFRFDQLTLVRSNRHLTINTSAVSRVGRATKARDAKTIGIPAAGGAIVGGIVGGKKGAAIGAAAGAGGGTAVVLSTRGPDVRLGRGYVATVRLLSPVTIRVWTEG
jgi:hypothetical protein